MVQYFKDGTSRVIRQENPELEEFLWDDSFLADGYFAETVVIAQEEMAQHYIREQTSSRELKLRPLRPWSSFTYARLANSC